MAARVKEKVLTRAEVSPTANGLQEGTAEAAPPMPTPATIQRGWFARTWQYLLTAHLLNDPDEILAFSHAPRSVTVRLASGQEYCIDKGSL